MGSLTASYLSFQKARDSSASKTSALASKSRAHNTTDTGDRGIFN
jgi:hypothetical protein